MDESTKEKLVAACAGMSVDQIATALVASKHASSITDPLAVAAYLLSLAA